MVLACCAFRHFAGGFESQQHVNSFDGVSIVIIATKSK